MSLRYYYLMIDIYRINIIIDGTLLLLPDDRKNYTGYLLGRLGTLGTYPNSLMIGKANVRNYKIQYLSI